MDYGNDAGRIVSTSLIASEPAKIIEIPFSSGLSGKDTYITVSYRNSDFARSSSIYNHNIGIISSGLSNAAYSPASITDALYRLEFQDLFIGNYDADPSYAEKGIDVYHDSTWKDKEPDTVGFSFAHKPITADGKEYNLIAVVVRGTVGKEWFSNFKIGDQEDHAGFSSAKSNIAIQLETYLSKHNLNDASKNKFLITGHSRGAAVANLLAADLTKNSRFAAKDSIYSYTFATPNTTRKAEAKDSDQYNNIFNYINAEDFVPYMPLSAKGWDYGKYGKTLLFPGQGVDADYQKYTRAMHENFQEITDIAYGAYENKGYSEIQYLSGNLSDLIRTPNDYNHTPLRLLHIGFGLYTKAAPKQYFYYVSDCLANESIRSMLIIWRSSQAGDYQDISKFFNISASQPIPAEFIYPHAPETYIAWMQATSDTGAFSADGFCKYARVDGSVDIQVYDSKGSLVGKVSNKVVDESIKSDVSIYVKDGINHVYMPAYDTYIIKFVGKGTGKMNYRVETIDIATTLPVRNKEFKNISLSAGKEMTSEIGEIQDVKVLITKDSRVIGEIAQDGTEQ
jgi:hypothetical protein